jgi:hypothetical protein
MAALLTEEQVAERLHVSVASLRRCRLSKCGLQLIEVDSLVRYRLEDLKTRLLALPAGIKRNRKAISAQGSERPAAGTESVPCANREKFGDTNSGSAVAEFEKRTKPHQRPWPRQLHSP